jgi:sugar phosphate permease
VGPKPVLATGLALLLVAVLWYTRIPVDGSYPVDLLPAFVLYGIGIPFSFIPISIAALAGVEEREAGLASGLINTSQQVGGAIGVAVVSTVAISHAESLLAAGDRPAVAFTDGFQRGFWVIAAISLAALVASLVLLRREELEAEPSDPVRASA